jgi:hypothetical protein
MFYPDLKPGFFCDSKPYSILKKLWAKSATKSLIVFSLEHICSLIHTKRGSLDECCSYCLLFFTKIAKWADVNILFQSLWDDTAISYTEHRWSFPKAFTTDRCSCDRSFAVLKSPVYEVASMGNSITTHTTHNSLRTTRRENDAFISYLNITQSSS